MQYLRRWASLAVAGIGIACTDTATEQSVTWPTPAVSKISSTSQSSGLAATAPTMDAQASFHAKNYADWVGKAHNKALDDFFVAMLADQGAPKNFCTRVLEFMSEPARVPPGKNQATREQRRAYALRGSATTQACRGQLADNDASIVGPAGTVRLATFAGGVAGVSAAGNSLLNQIGSAQSAATTAGGLATSLTPILSQADQLVSGERDLVYATASVTQSSFEYWEANIGPQSQQVDVTYGPCLGQYPDEAYALSTCMGIGGGITPTGLRNLGSKARITFAAWSPSPCDGYLDKGAIGAYDFGGAVAGGAYGLFGGVGGALLGAISGGGAASATESWAQFGKWAHCKWTGGSGPPQPIHTT